jgi:hypothetical protein
MLTRLLTLVQVGDCWKYALEAIIKSYYHISMFMVMFILHAIIVLTGNLIHVWLCKQHRVPSKPLLD